MTYTSRLQKNAGTFIHSRRNPAAWGQRVRLSSANTPKRTRELGGRVPCVRISTVLPVPGRIHEEQVIASCQDLGS